MPSVTQKETSYEILLTPGDRPENSEFSLHGLDIGQGKESQLILPIFRSTDLRQAASHAFSYNSGCLITTAKLVCRTRISPLLEPQNEIF
jgi:hypothetical protein